MIHLRVELPDEVAAPERLIAEGEADVAAGQVVEHGQAMLQMRAWAALIRAKAEAKR
jgi:predicted transcriptional regulator